MDSHDRRTSPRALISIDYSKLHSAADADSVYDEDVEKFKRTLDVKSATFLKSAEKMRIHKDGTTFSLEWVQSHGLSHPVAILDRKNLGLELPGPDFTVFDVADAVGHDYPIDVIDVSAQSEESGWTLGRWADYFHRPQSRGVVRNVISLEFSGTPLESLVRSPRLVRQLDWIDNIWPGRRHVFGDYPRVQLYCLMSVAGSWTDFHIDFGGTSVWYHVHTGQKEFFFVEPTEAALSAYESWTTSPDQRKTFFGDLVGGACFRVRVQAGHTLIIPAGWIHAVFTPLDSLVFGGNFMHGYDMGMQLRIYELENFTRVPFKYRFPYYEHLQWYAAAYYLQAARCPGFAEAARRVFFSGRLEAEGESEPTQSSSSSSSSLHSSSEAVTASAASSNGKRIELWKSIGLSPQEVLGLPALIKTLAHLQSTRLSSPSSAYALSPVAATTLHNSAPTPAGASSAAPQGGGSSGVKLKLKLGGGGGGSKADAPPPEGTSALSILASAASAGSPSSVSPRFPREKRVKGALRMPRGEERAVKIEGDPTSSLAHSSSSSSSSSLFSFDGAPTSLLNSSLPAIVVDREFAAAAGAMEAAIIGNASSPEAMLAELVARVQLVGASVDELRLLSRTDVEKKEGSGSSLSSSSSSAASNEALEASLLAEALETINRRWLLPIPASCLLRHQSDASSSAALTLNALAANTPSLRNTHRRDLVVASLARSSGGFGLYDGQWPQLCTNSLSVSEGPYDISTLGKGYPRDVDSAPSTAVATNTTHSADAAASTVRPSKLKDSISAEDLDELLGPDDLDEEQAKKAKNSSGGGVLKLKLSSSSVTGLNAANSSSSKHPPQKGGKRSRKRDDDDDDDDFEGADDLDDDIVDEELDSDDDALDDSGLGRKSHSGRDSRGSRKSSSRRAIGASSQRSGAISSSGGLPAAKAARIDASGEGELLTGSRVRLIGASNSEGIKAAAPSSAGVAAAAADEDDDFFDAAGDDDFSLSKPLPAGSGVGSSSKFDARTATGSNSSSSVRLGLGLFSSGDNQEGEVSSDFASSSSFARSEPLPAETGARSSVAEIRGSLLDFKKPAAKVVGGAANLKNAMKMARSSMRK